MFGDEATIVATGFAEQILSEDDGCILQWDYDPYPSEWGYLGDQP